MARITKGYVDTPRGQVHYRTAGERGDRLPIVMLHQTASSSVMFEALMERLADDYFIFCPDTPGFGQSFLPEERGSIALYAESLLAACRAEGIERCWLFGHHTGATIAVEMLRQAPAFSEKLALSGPCLLSKEAAADLAAGTQGMVLAEDGSHFSTVWDRIQSKDADAPLEIRHREAVLTLVAGTRWAEGYHAVFEASDEFAQGLRALALPTLVFAGDKDTVFNLLEPIYLALREGTKAVIPGQTTYSCDRAPDEVSKLLRNFFPLV
jgi:haloalkane dehalogenase